MAHKLPLIKGEPKVKKTKKFTLKMPRFTGKFGISFFIGTQEVFLGISIAEVTMEEVVRRRTLKLPRQAKTKVYTFDSI